MWKHLGYEGAGNVQSLLKTEGSGPAVICGGARSVFDELEQVLEKEPKVTIFAVNDVGMYLANVHHWVSLHSDKLKAWRDVRALDSSLGQDFKTHSIPPKEPWDGIDYAWMELGPSSFAISGYFAMQVAYLMGFDPIILCGCPGDKTPRFFESSKARIDQFGYGTGENHYDKSVMEQLVNEMKRVPEFKKRVRSVFGFTKQFFGGI